MAGMTAATTALMNPNRCGGASPAATTTPKAGPRRSSTGRAAPAVPPSLKKQPAGAPQDATKLSPAGIKTTTSAPVAWLASGLGKLGMSDVPTLAPDERNGTTNAAAAGPLDAQSVLLANPHVQVLKMPLSAPAAVQRQTEAAPAPPRAPRATPGVPPNRHWPPTAPAATANPPAAHARPPADLGTTAPGSTTESIATPAADPAHQPGAGGLQRQE